MSVCPAFFLFLFLSFFVLSFFRPFLLPFFLSFSFLLFIHSFFYSFFLSCFLFSLSSCKKCSTIDRHIFSVSVCLSVSLCSFIHPVVRFFPFHSFIYLFIHSFLRSFNFFSFLIFSLLLFPFFSTILLEIIYV